MLDAHEPLDGFECVIIRTVSGQEKRHRGIQREWNARGGATLRRELGKTKIRSKGYVKEARCLNDSLSEGCVWQGSMAEDVSCHNGGDEVDVPCEEELAAVDGFPFVHSS